MKRMLVFILAVILFVLPGCNWKQNDAMVVCGTFGVPGFVVRDMNGGTYTWTELEQDSKGRILYEFSAKNILSEEWETALVICQAYDKNFVYFYEDKCCVMKDDSDLSIDLLKQQNDWNCSLDYSKMSKREIVIAIPSYVIVQSELKMNDVLRACQEALEDGRISIQDIQLVDLDGSGHELYYFKTDSQTEKYFAILDTQYKVALLEVKNSIDLSAFTAFKQQNGWEYGLHPRHP